MSQTMKKELSTMLLSSKLSNFQNRDTFNFSSLDKDEEIREITLQLVMIRKAYDYVVNQNSQKREQIDLMKKQISKLETTTETCTDDQSSISTRIRQMNKELLSSREKLEKENQDSKVLEHILTRTKADVIALEIKSTQLHKTLDTIRTHLFDYEKLSRRNKEGNVQSQRLLKSVSENLKIEKKNKSDLIKRLEKAAELKKQASERRLIRVAKQAEIAEIAANQNRNAEEIALKEQTIFYKLFWMLLNFKQEKAFRESEDAEEAFKRIRVATGLSNIKTVVEGFLKRDELVQELQNSISEQDKQLTVLKKRCEKIRNELNSILLISKESSSPYYVQLKELNEQIDIERKLYEKSFQASEVYERLSMDLKHILSKATSNLDLGQNPSQQEILTKLKSVCQEVSISRESAEKEVELAEKQHISSILKTINPGKDPRSKREVAIQQERNLSLEDNS